MAEVDVSDAASLAKAITELEKQMKPTAKRLEFKEAAQLRDRLKEPRAQQIYKVQGRGSHSPALLPLPAGEGGVRAQTLVRTLHIGLRQTGYMGDRLVCRQGWREPGSHLYPRSTSYSICSS